MCKDKHKKGGSNQNWYFYVKYFIEFGSYFFSFLCIIFIRIIFKCLDLIFFSYVFWVFFFKFVLYSLLIFNFIPRKKKGAITLRQFNLEINIFPEMKSKYQTLELFDTFVLYLAVFVLQKVFIFSFRRLILWKQIFRSISLYK